MKYLSEGQCARSRQLTRNNKEFQKERIGQYKKSIRKCRKSIYGFFNERIASPWIIKVMTCKHEWQRLRIPLYASTPPSCPKLRGESTDGQGQGSDSGFRNACALKCATNDLIIELDAPFVPVLARSKDFCLFCFMARDGLWSLGLLIPRMGAASK